ncbi:hypothetical protein OAS39_08030 [Pirellulales bacterium]|nr:hypothetical protein [Pirellulales bacterium]
MSLGGVIDSSGTIFTTGGATVNSWDDVELARATPGADFGNTVNNVVPIGQLALGTSAS